MTRLFDIRRCMSHGGRILAGSGLTLAALAGFAALGQDQAALFLAFLGWRWIFGIPALALEMAGVPHAASPAHLSGLRRTAGIVAAALVPFGLALLPGHSALFALAVTTWSALQVLLAPWLALALRRQEHGRHAVQLTLRRAVDPVALCLSWVLGYGFELFLLCHLLLTLVGGALLLSLQRPGRLPATEKPIFLPASKGLRYLAVVSGQVLPLRVPVVLLTALMPPETAVPISALFVMAAYVRQAGAGLLVGLDGLVAAAGLDPKGLTRQPASVALLAAALLSPIVILVAGQVDALPVLPCLLVLWGALARWLADLALKLATGQGAVAEVWVPVVLNGLLATCGYGLAALALPPALAGLAMTAVFALSNGVLALVLLARVQGRPDPVRTSRSGSAPVP